MVIEFNLSSEYQGFDKLEYVISLTILPWSIIEIYFVCESILRNVLQIHPK